jgi:DNA-binding cell septation regulator SpoVG
MEITDVRIFAVDEDELRAFVNITFDRCFTIRDLQLLEGADGYLLRMPTVNRPDGTFREIAFSLNAETHKMIENKVISEYKTVIAAKPSAGNTK